VLLAAVSACLCVTELIYEQPLPAVIFAAWPLAARAQTAAPVRVYSPEIFDRQCK